MIGKVKTFFQEVKIELGKVSWSTKEELINSTTVVFLSVLLLSLFIGICDFFFSGFINVLLRVFSSVGA